MCEGLLYWGKKQKDHDKNTINKLFHVTLFTAHNFSGDRQ
jgi:hypothetical protein